MSARALGIINQMYFFIFSRTLLRQVSWSVILLENDQYRAEEGYRYDGDKYNSGLEKAGMSVIEWLSLAGRWLSTSPLDEVGGGTVRVEQVNDYILHNRTEHLSSKWQQPFNPLSPILHAGSWLESTLVQNNKIKDEILFSLPEQHWQFGLIGLSWI